METEEQRKRRLELTQPIKTVRWNMDSEAMRRIEESARLGVIITREMAKIIRRNANKAPTVSDKIPRLPNK